MPIYECNFLDIYVTEYAITFAEDPKTYWISQSGSEAWSVRHSPDPELLNNPRQVKLAQVHNLVLDKDLYLCSSGWSCSPKDEAEISKFKMWGQALAFLKEAVKKDVRKVPIQSLEPSRYLIKDFSPERSEQFFCLKKTVQGWSLSEILAYQNNPYREGETRLFTNLISPNPYFYTCLPGARTPNSLGLKEYFFAEYFEALNYLYDFN